MCKKTILIVDDEMSVRLLVRGALDDDYNIKSDPESKEVPIIMISGVGHDLNKKLGMQFGANGYLTKSFKLEELEEAVEKYL